MSLRRLITLSLCALVTLSSSATLFAKTIYVDNRKGDDKFDGSTPDVSSVVAGPVFSIRRAMRLADQGDTIVIVNNNIPYYEMISMVGDRHSGFNLNIPTELQGDVDAAVKPVQQKQFLIIGNGSVVSGAVPVNPLSWEVAGESLWKITPVRKGYYQLLISNKPVPRHPCPKNAKTLPEIPVGHWCEWRGVIYYRSAPVELPATREFAVSYRDTGLSMLHVHDVIIRDLIFEHFRVDGVNLLGTCKKVVLENVSCYENGRAGMAITNSSQVDLANCEIADNGVYQLMISGKAVVNVDAQTRMSEQPTILKPVK